MLRGVLQNADDNSLFRKAVRRLDYDAVTELLRRFESRIAQRAKEIAERDLDDDELDRIYSEALAIMFDNGRSFDPAAESLFGWLLNHLDPLLKRQLSPAQPIWQNSTRKTRVNYP